MKTYEYFEYATKIIIYSSKRASRLLRNNTLWFDKSKSGDIEYFKKVSKEKKIFVMNREPLGHIKSGLVNIIEDNYKDSTTPLYRELNYLKTSNLGHYFFMLLYLSADENRYGVNYKNTTIDEVIPQEGLLNLLNWFVELYNINHKTIYQIILNDDHVGTDQDAIRKLKNSVECEVVDIEEHKNLLHYLGFSFSDKENDELKKRYSQSQVSIFFSMFIDYILSNDVNGVISHFKDIYGKCSVVRGSNVTRAKKYDYFIDYVNNEVKIYNEIK